jgi:tripartite-type tricarboxylate transporter receptor subunit TctC
MRTTAILAAFWGSCLAAAPAAAQAPAEPFYQGKVLTISIGFPPGGAFDLYARLVARHLGNFIPGHPTVVAQNVPGAGSLTLANQLYGSAPRDGTQIGTVEPGVPVDAFYGGKGVRFDPLKFSWIAGLNREVTTCSLWHGAKAKSFADVLTMDTPVGGTGSGAPPIIETKVINSVLGAKLKLIPGYPGTADIFVAMEKGEIDGACGVTWTSIKSVRAAWVRDGLLKPVVQVSATPLAELADVPLISDFAKTEEQRQLLKLLTIPNAIGRPYIAPPDVPADRLAILRDAFAAMTADAAFLADAKAVNLPIDPTPGARMAEMLADVAKLPKEIVAKMIAARE